MLGSTYSFGKYPQSVVEDATLISALNSAIDTDGDGYLEYGDDEYAKVAHADLYVAGTTSVSGHVTFISNSPYYFKVEPIEWEVIKGSGTSSGLLTSKYILDSGYYANIGGTRIYNGKTSITANSYEYSQVRASLNGLNASGYDLNDYSDKGLLQKVFSDTEQNLIQTSTVDNSSASTGQSTNPYISDDTNDKLFLLCYADIDAYNLPLKVAPSDYSRVRHVFIDSSTGNGSWWTRSPSGLDGDHAWTVDKALSMATTSVAERSGGVRPALNITIS